MTTPRALFAGSFDPITLGHVELIRRAAALLGGLRVSVGSNFRKQTLFSADERVAMAREALRDIAGVVVGPFDGLLVDHARASGCTVLVRGVRGAGDFPFEHQSAQVNFALAPEIETVWLVASPATAFISSTMVREIAHHGGDASAYVPPSVASRLRVRGA